MSTEDTELPPLRVVLTNPPVSPEDTFIQDDINYQDGNDTIEEINVAIEEINDATSN